MSDLVFVLLTVVGPIVAWYLAVFGLAVLYVVHKDRPVNE